jgi:hypothetical protein
LRSNQRGIPLISVHVTDIIREFIVDVTDGMRRPVSGRDAIRSQVIDVLEAQKIKETGNEEG